MPCPHCLLQPLQELSRREIPLAGSLNDTLHYAIHDRKYAHVARSWAIRDGAELIGIPYTKSILLSTIPLCWRSSSAVSCLPGTNLSFRPNQPKNFAPLHVHILPYSRCNWNVHQECGFWCIDISDYSGHFITILGRKAHQISDDRNNIGNWFEILIPGERLSVNGLQNPWNANSRSKHFLHYPR